MRPEFVAVDGEADEQGRYILLCDSTGRVLHNPDGIGSRQAFEFLLPLSHPHRQIVCFGLNYDANQWLADLRPGYLRRLAQEGSATWRYRYKLRWMPSKFFSVKDNQTQRHVKVCEVFGFFQTSFVNALKQWGLEPPAEIVLMKSKRGTFTAGGLQRITDYCLAECRLLVQLMNRLADACDTAGCLPARDWIGAGSIAASLLRSHGVAEHHVHDADLPGATRETVENVILGAYYGGRVELLAQGVMPVCHTRDIRSAYPHAAVHLPSLTRARVKHRKRYTAAPWAIWRVKWRDQAHGQLAPFPVRSAARTISYPRSGEGCYHSVEVATALKLGYALDVIEGWVLEPVSSVEPLSWLGSLYRHRAKLKAAGDPAAAALKLGLNSVYGKLAQGYSFGRHPPYQQYWWAGHITAQTRARMLETAHKSDHVCMVSTDGIFAYKTACRASAGASLGSWEADTYTNLFCAQPGVYRGFRGDATVTKSRGFFAREVDYDELETVWSEDRLGAYYYDSRRFIGLKVALHRNRLDLWRQWVTERRSVALEPERKIPGATHPRTGMMLLYPPDGGIESVPYTPKQSLYDDPTDTQLENMVADDQPHYEGIDE